MNKTKQVYNPYLPLYEYVPDGEPRVFDGRAYIYGSHDFAGGEKYCMGDYVTWSAPVDDLSDWRYEGVIYKRTQDPSNKENQLDLWAPDVVKGTDGKYYLYYCFSFLPEIGVAVSDSPAGPFDFLGHVKYPEHIMGGKELNECFPFNPAVLVDDDGSVYLYYGFSPAGELSLPSEEELMKSGMNVEEARAQLEQMKMTKFSEGGIVVGLENDMVTTKGEPRMFIPGGNIAGGTEFEDHGFFEASSMRKVNGKYYFVYSSQVSHELCYATSDYPDKEFSYGGVIVSNGDIGYQGNQKPRGMMGNNHGGIIQIENDWYIFYHRQTHGTESSRQGCAEKIKIGTDGSIAQVEMTSCGLNGGPLDGTGTYPAAIACNLICETNAGKIIYGQSLKEIQPYIFEEQIGDKEENHTQYIANITNGTIIGFKYFDCKDIQQVQVCVCGHGAGQWKIALDREESEAVGSIEIQTDGDEWTTFTTKVNIPDGIHSLYFVYTGEGAIDFKDFTFCK